MTDDAGEDPAVSDNTVSEDTASENSVSENTLPETIYQAGDVPGITLPEGYRASDILGEDVPAWEYADIADGMQYRSYLLDEESGDYIWYRIIREADDSLTLIPLAFTLETDFYNLAAGYFTEQVPAAEEVPEEFEGPRTEGSDKTAVSILDMSRQVYSYRDEEETIYYLVYGKAAGEEENWFYECDEYGNVSIGSLYAGVMLASENPGDVLDDSADACYAYINTAEVKEIKDGTIPFDDAEGKGNDTGNSNKIVRTFDEINYLIDLNMAIYDDSEYDSFRECDVHVEAILPLPKDKAEFNLEAMP